MIPHAMLLLIALATSPAHPSAASIDSVGRYAAPLNASYTNEEVRIRAPEGHVLAGTLSKPIFRFPGTKRPPVPVVVLISGASQQDRDLSSPGGYRPFFQVADTLARRGIAVLRLDDRGFGASTGKLDTTDMADRASDVRAAIAYLKKRREFMKSRIGLLGHSEGGEIAPYLAAKEPAVRAMVLLASPGRTGREIVHWQRRRWADRDTTRSQAYRDSIYQDAIQRWEDKAAHDKWTRFFGSYDPLLTARKVRTPVLILQGSADESLPSEEAERLMKAFLSGGNRDVTLRSFDGLTHAFVVAKEFGPEGPLKKDAVLWKPPLLGLIADWFVKRLPPS